MIQTVLIKDIQHKVSKAGKPWQTITTDKGEMTCHDNEILLRLEKCFNKGVNCELETAESGDYVNIRRFVNEFTTPPHPVKPTEAFKPLVTNTEKSPVNTNDSKTATMYTSYAKDVFIAQMNNPDVTVDNSEKAKSVMNEAINLVKQAREAFS